MLLAVAHQVCVFPHLAWWGQFLHPGQLRTPCGGYWSWSGIISDAGEYTIALSIAAGIAHSVLKHNCHVDGCKSIITSVDPKVHAPACRRHHSLGHLHGIDHSVRPGS